MATYTELLNSLESEGLGRIRADIPDSWMQGRTTYGGLTAALSLEAAMSLVEDMPVRCAQVAFVGPVGGLVSFNAELLRRGKSSAFVSVDALAEGQVMARTLFTFGAVRESSLSHETLPAPDAARPEDLPSFFSDRRPNFAHNFNLRQAAGSGPVSGADHGDVTLWLRHKDEAAPVSPVTLLSIGDTPPPAAMSMLSKPAPISSMTWMAEFLSEDVSTRDGWYLVRHVAETARDGYSSQAMTMWSADGRPLMIGRQTIAIFG